MITEKEKRNRNELFSLMQEYPDLPVIPMVDEEVVCDDCCSWWLGSWGSSQIQRYLTTKERIYFDDDDPEDVLTAVKGWDWYEDATDAEIETEFKALPWIEAITVMIHTPEI